MSRPKARAKRWLQSKPALWAAYWKSKQQFKRLWLLRYFAHDIAHTYRAMFWPMGHRDRETLSAALLFQYHKLEKGLVMPGPKRLFGVEPARATLLLARRWLDVCHPSDDPVFLGAVQAVDAYAERLATYGLDPDGQISRELEAFLREVTVRDSRLQTPMPLPELRNEDGRHSSFARLAEARRSVRDFLSEPVPRDLIEAAAASAQLAPSACNRQPCRLLVVSDPDRKAPLLALQNGNRGFGQLIPHVAVCTADESCFFDASERHEPYIDGGLFAMSFILALRDLGVSSCCLNWCVSPANDRSAHRLLEIPCSQRIVMLIAFGFAPEKCMVPRSPRRAVDEVLTFQ